MIKHIEFIKFAKIVLRNPLMVIPYFKYILNIFLIKIFKFNFKTIPNLNKLFDVKKIDIEDNFLHQVFKDIEIKEYNFVKNSNVYQIYNFNESYLDEVKFAWGFDRLTYIDFFETKLGNYARKIYNGANYRIQHVWLFKSYKNSINANSALHTDGDMPGALKVMIYLNDVDEESGPFTVFDVDLKQRKIITGTIGTVIFFNQNALPHAALANKSKDRLVLTFLLYPTLRRKIDYNSQTIMNAQFNLNPFSKNS